MQNWRTKTALGVSALAVMALTVGLASTVSAENKYVDMVPAEKFDLSNWYITVPVDDNNDGKSDNVYEKDLATYEHSDFFYLDDNGYMVFTTPNKAATTANSTNTRSELRQMLRTSSKMKTSSPQNNWVLAASPFIEPLKKKRIEVGSIGGRLDATLHVDHVAKRAEVNNKKPTYSVVIGQIHALKLDKHPPEYGWGNEPLKISFKKFPDHEYGSVYWAYERNLPKDDKHRTDIAYPVWGNTWDNFDDPGTAGIKLGEEMSYTVNVLENVMYLTFTTERHGTKEFAINLANAVDANGELDELDNPYGYTGDMMYFKAGAYNQCSSQMKDGMWYPGCLGTGDWETDQANGDYAQVSFHSLSVGPATPVE